MPTPVGFADCSVFIKHQLDDREWAITFGVQTNLAGFSPEDHAAHVFGVTAAAWDSETDNAAVWTRSVLRFGQDGGDDLVAEFASSPLPGTSTSEKLPQNCAMLIRKVTNFGGRKNRGRCYLPGVLSEASVNEVGGILTTPLNAYRSIASAWLDALEDDNGGIEPSTPMVILHSDATAPTPVTSLVVDGVIATQRRRLRR